MPFHIQSDWCTVKSLIIPSIGENVEKQEFSYVATVNQYKHFGKQVGTGQPSCKRARPTYDSAIPLLGIPPTGAGREACPLITAALGGSKGGELTE